MPRKIKTHFEEDKIFCFVGPTSSTVFALNQEPRELDSDDPRELVLPPAQPDFDAPSPGRRVSTRKLPPLVHWVERNLGDTHRKAVRASDDAFNAGTYICRAVCLGHLMVGRLKPLRRFAVIAYEKICYKFNRYEVLVVERGYVKWEPCRDGNTPPHALPAGLTLTGRPIYAVRVHYEETTVPGQLIAGEKVCRVSLKNRELKFPDYEVLTVVDNVRHAE